MPRLLRPTINLETKLRVLLRTLGEAFLDDVVKMAAEQRCLGTIVRQKQEALAGLLGCDPGEINYDHDPPLGARKKIFVDGRHVEYEPRANDPEFLFARALAAHRLKTNVRGDHGQHPDRVLIKKNRRLEEREQEKLGLRKPKPKARMRGASRWPPKGSRPLKGKSRW